MAAVIWMEDKVCSRQKEKANTWPPTWDWRRVEGKEAREGRTTEAKVGNMALASG